MTDLTGQPTFDDFWLAYPRKIAKADAKRSWDKAVTKIKIDPADIVAGAKRYAAAKRGTEQQYIAHAATWINQQRWADEDVEAKSTYEEERPHVRDEKAIGVIAATMRAQEIKKRILVATRAHHQASLSDAARRLNVTESEFWGCMSAGSMGFDARAWKAACAEVNGGPPAPEVLNIGREHWIDGKERLETRARTVPVMRQQGQSFLR